MFTVALFTTAEIWKQPQYPISTDGWMKKMCFTYKIECYSTFKEKKILSLVRIYMNLEDIMLSEISQTHKHKYCMDSLICVVFF